MNNTTSKTVFRSRVINSSFRKKLRTAMEYVQIPKLHKVTKQVLQFKSFTYTRRHKSNILFKFEIKIGLQIFKIAFLKLCLHQLSNRS